MVSFLYLLCCIGTFVLLALLLFCKRPNIYFVMVFICAVIQNYGLWSCSVAKNASEAALGSRCIYLGGVWISFFMILSVIDICGIRVPKVCAIIATVVNTIMLIYTQTIGLSTVYYKSLEIRTGNGATYMIKEYGPMHKVYLVYVIVYMLLTFLATLYGIRNRSVVSYKYAILLMTIFVINTAFYFMRILLHSKFDFACISYTISLAILYYLQCRMELYDSTFLEAGRQVLEEQAIIYLDKNLIYMGCSDNATAILPELKKYKMECPIPAEETTVYQKILPWVIAFDQFQKSGSQILELGDKIYRCEISYYQRQVGPVLKKIGFLVVLSDDTKQQNYINSLNAYTQKLHLKEEELRLQKEMAEKKLLEKEKRIGELEKNCGIIHEKNT